MKGKRGTRRVVNSSARKGSPQVRAVFLVGFMGSGKTSVGQALSRRMGWPFEDLDDRIVAREGRTIEAVFRESGEIEFRRAENAALRELLGELGSSPRVVALGGGAFVQAENFALIESAGVHTVFLDANPEELYRRCEQEQRQRPLRQSATQFYELYGQRRTAYLKARCQIETRGKDVDAVAAEVQCSLVGE
jgi:shikimate kinase